MKQQYLLLTLLLLPLNLLAQQPLTYTTSEGATHLTGPFELSVLETTPKYAEWFNQSYNAYQMPQMDTKWAKKLKPLTVDIYMATWCGDTKFWVPRFVKLWDELGLQREQLNFTALYGSSEDGKYKQGPNNETASLRIHRVPTFIFRSDGVEIARMVESPSTSLFTDLKQIALHCPSAPNYAAADYLTQLFATTPVAEVKDNLRQHLIHIWGNTLSDSELNTLGHVLQDAGKLEEALVVFELNTSLYKYVPRVYTSFAQALAAAEDKAAAVDMYLKAIEIDAENSSAKKGLKALL